MRLQGLYPDNLIKEAFGDGQLVSVSPVLPLNERRLKELEYILYNLLTDKQRLVIKERFENNLTYEKVGEIAGITRSRVGQVINKSCRIIRENWKLTN